MKLVEDGCKKLTLNDPCVNNMPVMYCTKSGFTLCACAGRWRIRKFEWKHTVLRGHRSGISISKVYHGSIISHGGYVRIRSTIAVVDTAICGNRSVNGRGGL